ncbi:MAG TPA: hypothetical protein VNY84_04465, partial [Acidimicrobiales bacterium]|nr:hypothetical protein [Acidimicrobiales bacterium]
SKPLPSGSGPFAVLPNSFDFFAGVNQRVAFALATNNGDPIHPTSPVTVQIGPLDGALGAAQPTVLHNQGLANPYLLTYNHFEAPGMYQLVVSYQGKQANLPIQVIRPQDTKVPLAGSPMVSLPTATLAKPLGVDPVCTDQPPCPFHDVSLDVALSQHKMVALMFATPALCQSKFCGPTLDNLVAVHQPFADKVTFIHCEIYTDLTGTTSTPPVLAYHLEHEPMLLLAGADGAVHERIDNAFDRLEATDALNRLTAAS